MLQPQDAVAVGVSGGADSVCLLFALKELQKKMPFRILVVHVNHGIRQEASRDEEYVRTLCEQWKLPFFSVHVQVTRLAEEQGISTEEAGRNVRYESFERILKKEAGKEWEAGKARIAVAHNANDRAETMLFHLVRGTGLTGLCSIKPVRERVIRPLLGITREEIEEFLQKEKLSYCIDHTNAEDTYTRNKIRNHILPYITEEISPAAIHKMNQAADLLNDAEAYLKKQTAHACDRVFLERQEEHVKLSVEKLLSEDPYLQKEILLEAVAALIPGRKDIGAVHIEALQKLLHTGGSKELFLPCGLKAVKEYDALLLIIAADPSAYDQKPVPEEQLVSVPGEYELEGLGKLEFSLIPRKKTEQIPENQYTKWFDYDKIKKCLCVRKRRTGDYLTINEALSRKSLKEYMIEEKIPKACRDDIWVLAEEDHILWVIGRRISAKYKVSEDTKTILQVQLRGGLSCQST